MSSLLYRFGLSRRPGARVNANALGVVVSIGVHVVLAILVFALTLTVVAPTRFARLDLERLTLTDPPDPTDLSTGESPGLPGAPTPLRSGRAPEPVTSIGEALDARIPMPSMAVDDRTLDDLPRVRTAGATFAGLRARKARSVVYVVDASGPMASSLSFVFEELRRSVARLGDTQTFQAIVFRDTGEGHATIAFPGRPAPANELNTRGLALWLDDITPGGRSNPLDGLRAALRSEPDVVFLLARSIRRSGANSSWGRGMEAIVAELAELNPIDRESGDRPTVIKTIQFIDEDPTGIMQAIAARHGDGPGSYRLLTIGDLGRVAIEDEPDEVLDPAIDRVIALLDSVADESARLLYGLLPDEERRLLHDVLRKASNDVRQPTDDARAPFVEARIAILLANVDPVNASRHASRALETLPKDTLPDPRHEASRLLHHALAHLAKERPGDARALLERALLLPVEHGPTRLELRLALLQVDASEILRLRAALREGTLAGDAGRALLTIEAITRARLRHEPRADAFGDLLHVLEHDAIRLSDAQRRAWVFQHLVDLTERSELASLPPEATLAHAVLEKDDALLRRLLQRDDAAHLHPMIRWELASDAPPEMALALLEPLVPSDANAARHTIALARDLGDDDLRRTLTRAIEHHASDDDIDLWIVELARLDLDLDDLPSHFIALLSLVDADSAYADRAADLAVLGIRGALERTRSRLRRLELAEGGVAICAKHRRPEVHPMRIVLAETLLEQESPDALNVVREIDPVHVEGGEITTRLLMARAHLARRDDARAFDILRTLAKDLEGTDHEGFWQAWALMLETLRRQPGEHDDTVRLAVAALRDRDADLGGSPWRERILATMP